MKSFLKVTGSLLAVCAALICASNGAWAQGLGSISGTVTDATGAVVAGATVTATQAGTGLAMKTSTGGEGLYVFPTLAPSIYNLSVSHPGFAKYTKQSVQVRADAAVTVNITLKTGSATETVTVTADTAQVDVTTGTLSEVIGGASVNELPLNGRNAAALTAEVAGVVVAPYAQADQGNTKTFPTAYTITANGTRVGQTNYMLDGGNNVDEYTNVNLPFPMPDSVQEFSIETNNYSAQYGQNAGAVVNIITKSGTSKYHGDLFEFVRNRYFNAAPYFSTTGRDTIKRNQFGGTVGGPLNIPHVLKTDKSFFFFGYQRTINHQNSASSSNTLPTIAQAGANSSGTSAGTNNLVFTDCAYDPLNPTAALTPTISGCATNTSNVWPSSVLDPVTTHLLQHLPALTTSGTVSFQTPNMFTMAEMTARGDTELTPKDKMTLRYFSDAFILAGSFNPANLLTYADGAANHYYNSLFSETHTFSDHLVNNFILSYQWDRDSRGPSASAISVDDLGATIPQPAFKQINQIKAVNGSTTYFNIGANPQAFFVRANYTLTDDLHYLMGKHNVDVGYHGEVSKVDVNNLYEQPGQYTFSTSQYPDAMANLLFGNVSVFAQASGQFLNLRGKFQGAYFQDSWKASHNLTLNFGVRYEPFVPWHELQGRMGGFSPSLWTSNTHSTMYPNAPAGMQFAGDPGFNKNGAASSYLHFMPRAGFAWDVFGNGKTSVRGGGGMFFDSRISSVLFNMYTTGLPPFITAVNLSAAGTSTSLTTSCVNTVGACMNFTNPYISNQATNPFPATMPINSPPPGPSFSITENNSWLTFDPFHGFQDPVVYDWNLAVEQQVTRSLSARAAYVASHSSHEWTDVELNPTLNSTGTTATRLYFQGGCTLASTSNPNPIDSSGRGCYQSTITEANTGGNMNYNSLQLSAEQRVRYGLTVLYNFVWSKSLDNQPWNQSATSVGAGSSYVYPIYMPNFKALDYGPSDFNHKIVSELSYVYTIPKVLRDSPAAVQYLVNGWSTTGLFQIRSGDPLTIWSSSPNISESGQGRDRAVQTGAAYGGTACGSSLKCKSYLNPTSFTIPTYVSSYVASSYGTVKKGSFVGPRYVDWDASIARKFQVYKRADLQFRAEYFNLMNHTNLGDPATTLGTSFGKITSTNPQNWAGNTTGAPQNDPRIAQFSLKLVF